jgi:hypothetical protein
MFSIFRLGLFYNELLLDTIIYCTVSKLDETWLKSSLAVYHYVRVQQLDDICGIRR